MKRDYSKSRVVWTKHARDEVTEDNFKKQEIEESLSKVIEFPEFEDNKTRGIIKVGERYCTIIYKRMTNGIIIITCWESNPTDVREYYNVVRER